MNLVSVMISISIMSFAMLGSLQAMNNQFRANATTQVVTDVNSFVNNAKSTPPMPGCYPTMGFCYINDFTEVGPTGQTYMVFDITKNVFGPNTVRRLKPVIAPIGNTMTGMDNGNHTGEIK